MFLLVTHFYGHITICAIILYSCLCLSQLCFVDPTFYSVEESVPDFDDILPYGQFSLDER